MNSAGRRVLWATLVAGALAGAIGFELAHDALVDYPVAWRETTVDHVAQESTLAEGERFTRDVEIRFANVTEIRARLEWTDDTGEPDRFEISLAAPNGSQVAREEGSQSPLEAPAAVQAVPQRSVVEATSHEAARRQLVQDHATRVNATWTVTIELLEAPGASPASGIPETEADGSNDFTLRVQVTTYRGVVEPV